MKAGSEVLAVGDVQALVQRIAQAIPETRAIYLFGSAAENRLRPDSDLDLAVLASATIDSDRLFALKAHAAAIAGREVDLIDLRAVPLALQAQVVGRGRCLAVFGAATEIAFFENQVLSRYLAFVEERRPLVAEVRRRGAIHAA